MCHSVYYTANVTIDAEKLRAELMKKLPYYMIPSYYVHIDKVLHRLTTEQLYVFDYQLYTPMSTMYNLFSLMKFDKQLFELPRLVNALTISIKNHPALLTKFTFTMTARLFKDMIRR